MNNSFKVKHYREIPSIHDSFNEGIVYYDLHIQLNTLSYVRTGKLTGFRDSAEQKSYLSSMREILAPTGFDLYPNIGPRVHSSNDPYAGLYIHPDEISGTMTLAHAESISSALQQPNSPSSFAGILVIGRAEVIPAEEVRLRVGHHKASIIKGMLEAYRISSTSGYKFYPLLSLTDQLGGLQLLENFHKRTGIEVPADVLKSALKQIREELVCAGYLAENPTNRDEFRTTKSGISTF